MPTVELHTTDWAARVRKNIADKFGESVDAVHIKAMDGRFKAKGDDGDRFSAIISNATLDTDAEVLLPSGMMAKRSDNSGAGFYMHDYSRPPIFVPGKVTYDGTNLSSDARWLDTPFAREVREFVEVMAEEGKSAGVSVGAIYHETRKPTAKDKATFGDSVKSVVSKWELLEWSIAPIQANPDAMVSRIGKTACKSLWPGWSPPNVVDTAAIKRVADAQRELRHAAAMVRRSKDAARLKAVRDRAEKRDRELDEAVKVAWGRQRGLLWV